MQAILIKYSHKINVHIFPPATLTMMTPHQSMLTLVLTVVVLALPSTITILTVQPNPTTPRPASLSLSMYIMVPSISYHTAVSSW